MMVGCGCDVELRLGIGHHCSSADSDFKRCNRVEGESRITAPHHHQQQQITIFYNGRICVCDVTDIQARTIISMANREMDESENHRRQHETQDQHHRRTSSPPPQPPPSSPPALPQLLNPGLSMKRSLQRFLRKRKTRINASSPYHYGHHFPTSPSL